MSHSLPILFEWVYANDEAAVIGPENHMASCQDLADGDIDIRKRVLGVVRRDLAQDTLPLVRNLRRGGHPARLSTLAGWTLEAPPLRRRREDVLALAADMVDSTVREGIRSAMNRHHTRA